MANCNIPILDLIMIPTYNVKTLAIGDSSTYPVGFATVAPTLQIIPPGFTMKTNGFVAGSIQVYNAFSLGLTLDATGCSEFNLPDGIYTVIYSLNPANIYNVTKNFLRVDQIYSDMDSAFLKLEMMECDGIIKREKKYIIDTIEYYIQGAIAAANKCALKLSTDMYNKARKMLDEFIHDLNCCTKTW